MSKRNYMALMHDYLDEMSELSDEEFGRLCRMLLTYSITGECPDPQGNERFYLKRVIAQENRMQELYDQKAETNKRNGSSGGRPKKTQTNPDEPRETENNPEKPNVTQRNPEEPKKTQTNPDEPKKTNSSSISSSISISPYGDTPPISPSRGKRKATQELPDKDFEAFWDLYPNKKSKGEAKKAWKQLKPSREIISAIMAKLPLLITSPAWTKEGGAYIPYPATWLRAEGWEDVPTAGAPPGKAVNTPTAPEQMRRNAEWMRQMLESAT